MAALLNGIWMGIILTILVGPIAFALIDASINKGTKYGIVLGSGVWLSDFIFILTVYLGINYVREVINNPSFEWYTGLAGGIILMIFGLTSFFTKPPSQDDASNIKGENYFEYFIKGFLINTVNPFTVFFWTGVMSKIVIGDNYGQTEALLFFIGILGTIVLTDTLKVVLAKLVKTYLTERNLTLLRRISGIALFLFGIVLIYRVS